MLANYGRQPQLVLAGHSVGDRLAKLQAARSLPAVDEAEEGFDHHHRRHWRAARCARQLRRLALRAGAGLARTGSVFGHGSGDIVLAFSTAYTVPDRVERPMPAVAMLHDGLLDGLFQAAADSTEQAIHPCPVARNARHRARRQPPRRTGRRAARLRPSFYPRLTASRSMKVLISTDIEGVAGVYHSEQVRPGNPEFERARLLMTQEANAAIAGAFDAGATEVLVNDSHGGFRNMPPDVLDARARVVQGKPRYLSMVAGVEEGVDAVCMVGYHSRAQGRGILAHTINSFAFAGISLGGQELGEAGLYGALAGEYGAPGGDGQRRRRVHRREPPALFRTRHSSRPRRRPG